MKRWWLFLSILMLMGWAPPYLHADDTDLFTVKVPPDVLIILDLSGSMNWTPPGQILYISNTQDCSINGPFYGNSAPGRTKACSVAQIGGPIYGDSLCNEPFYKSSGGGYTTNCSRLAIAKRVIFDILDDTNNNVINVQDETSLGIRFGYMRFYNCGSGGDTGTDYNKDCNRLIKPFNTAYNQINNSVEGESAAGGTALVYSLEEAKLYLDASKTGDTAAACRKKFVILITDGEDTLSCGGTGGVNKPGDYARRRETVAKAKVLADAGYKVFVVGFGAEMPHYLKNTLNWAAKYGGTDNPKISNSGDLAGYNPSLVTSCQASPELSHNLGEGSHYYAESNDPGEISLSGYAFLAENASQLGKDLTAILKYIQERSYSYTAPTIPLVRIVDKDVGYISSFIPNETPFWKGNLKAYRLNEDGTLSVDADGNPLNANLIWDAVEELKNNSAGSRRIYTYINGTTTEFRYANLTNLDLDVSSDTERANLINHIRGIDAYDIDQNGNTTEERAWKLGDIFHSNAVIVGSPNRYFEDAGFSGPGEFYDTHKNRTKIILAGGNDGMLHAFNAGTGVEEWAFIPPSVLKTLKNMATTHTYYVDSSPKVSDVWLYSSVGDKTKTKDEWRTILICGLRRGGKQYFALDITDTLNPVFLWEFPRSTDAATLAKVGQSWSEPAIGKVKIEYNSGSGSELYERWVAFIGGGFDPTETKANNATMGKAFFVIDTKTGNILWEYSRDDSINYPESDPKKYMVHSFPAPPKVVDTNSDGYVDKVYIGDLGGQMWVFNVSFNASTQKSESLWTGYRLLKPPSSPSEKHTIYYQAAVSFDDKKIPWVYWGTGDRENPTDTTNPPERFYGVMDDGLGTYPRLESDLQEVTSVNTFTPNPLKKGWFLILERTGQLVEKVLARPVVFNQLVYFTTYAYKGNATGCSIEGDARLYILKYNSGGGALHVDELTDLSGTPSSQRYKAMIGAGVPSYPVISVNTKGTASVIIGTTNAQVFSQQIFSSGAFKSLLYWREVTR